MTTVLVVATSLARTSGGGRTFLEGLLTTLSHCDVELHIVVPTGSAEVAKGSAPEANLIEVPALHGLARVLRDLWVARLWSTRARADIVIHPNDLMPRVDVPLVTVVQNIGPFHPSSRKEFGFRGAMYRHALSRGRAVAVVSVSETARLYLASVLDIPGSHVIREAVLLPCPPGGGDRNRVTVVSGTAAYKGAGVAEHAAAACRASGLEVSIVGGRYGHLERSALLQLFADSVSVIYPSRVESFGLPAVEAAGMGARPIVLRGTAMAELLDGVAYVADDDATLVATAESIAAGRIAPLSEGERDHVREHFSPTSVAIAWTHLFEEVLHG